MSKTRKVYFARLVGRCLILIFSIALLIYDKSQFEVLQDWNFFREFSVLHILWLIWLIDMVAQLVPAKGYIALGSQKHFLKRFQPVVERINYDALKEYIVNTTKSAYKVFLIWCLLIIAIATLYFTDVLSREIIFIISVFFYVCDLICVLIWCPFRLLMKNKCCTTCRIFNWDHLMMFFTIPNDTRFLYNLTVGHCICSVGGMGIMRHDVSGTVLGKLQYGTEVFRVYG